MTDINHRRDNRKPVNQRRRPEEYNNGWVAPSVDGARPRVGRTGFLDKSMCAWAADAPVSGQRFATGITNDFTAGHRGMARAVKGAKKFVRSRVRFHDNFATRQLARDLEDDCRALYPWELDEDDLRALEIAETPPEAAEFDEELGPK